MGPLLRFVSALVCVLAVAFSVAAPVEAGGFSFRRSVFAPVVVQPQAFVLQQRFVAPRQRIVVAPQAIVVPQAFSFQQQFVAPIQVQSFSSGCGALIVR